LYGWRFVLIDVSDFVNHYTLFNEKEEKVASGKSNGFFGEWFNFVNSKNEKDGYIIKPFSSGLLYDLLPIAFKNRGNFFDMS
jgi:hypothetical protein